ncbi:MAG UNVERIFIED_CONTAM: hypothetical protein LVR29_30220 [Microcystis novacekii LVE1205-3]
MAGEIAAILERGNLTDEAVLSPLSGKRSVGTGKEATGELLRQLKNETHDSSRVDGGLFPTSSSYLESGKWQVGSGKSGKQGRGGYRFHP